MIKMRLLSVMASGGRWIHEVDAVVGQYQLNVSNWQNGIYILNVDHGQIQHKVKLVCIKYET